MIKTFSWLLAAVLLCVFVRTPAWSADRPVVIPLRDIDGGAQLISAVVNGQSGMFLFDTGWGLSIVTPSFAGRIGCKPWGRITGFRAIGERVDMQECNAAALEIQGVKLSLPTLGMFDIGKFLPPSALEISGGTGLDIFAGRVVTVQQHAGRIVLETPASLGRRVRQAHAVPIRVVRSTEGAALTVDIGVLTAAGTAWMELDTGNTGRTMIARHVAALLGLNPDVTGDQPLAMPLVPGIAVDGQARVLDLILDGDVGRDFLEQWDLTLDLQRGLGWLAPAVARPL